MTVREIGWLIRSRKVSCKELVEQTFADLRERDKFNSLITLTADEALAEAKQRDRELAAGIDRGPFHGVPVAYKDLFYTRGVRTTGGSLLFRDFVPEYNATAVERLETAGAISIGKTNLHELAYGITSKNPHYGWVRNPLDPTRLAGGSSGGSAALIAGGFIPMSLGTDTGGSIRIPASFCGIVGLKPTYGRVSRHGVVPLTFSLDHVGPLGACVDDCAVAMNVIAGRDVHDSSSANVPVPDYNGDLIESLRGVNVGVPRNFFFDAVDEEVESAVRKSVAVMERLGALILEVDVPDMEQANAAARMIQLPEAAAVYYGYDDPALFGADVWALIEQGRMVMGHEYINAQRVRTLFRRDFDELWTHVDVLATPATPTVAPGIDEASVTIRGAREDTRMASTRLVRAVNFLGEPALSMPCGKTAAGLPVGLQLISAPFSEARLFAIARTVESAVR